MEHRNIEVQNTLLHNALYLSLFYLFILFILLSYSIFHVYLCLLIFSFSHISLCFPKHPSSQLPFTYLFVYIFIFLFFLSDYISMSISFFFFLSFSLISLCCLQFPVLRNNYLDYSLFQSPLLHNTRFLDNH